MAENLKEIIARLKTQNSQISKPATKPAPVEEKKEDDGYNEEDDEEEQETVTETPKAEEKAVESKVNPKNKESKQITEDQQKAIIQQIEALQNNGVYRIEMLGALDEIKKTLVVIAGTLVNISGVMINDKQK